MAEKTGYRATTKFLIASPSKTRAVAKVVSKKDCSEAMAVLENMPQKGAKLIRSTMKSAIANALNANNKLDEDMLVVREVRVDDGPRLKRVWYRARGRADMLLKRMSHITVVVAEKAGE